MPDVRPAGVTVRLYLVFMSLARPLIRWILYRRLLRGKEHPDRWREKLGFATQSRPSGKLIWLHAVGLGEVMALRGIIEKLGRLDANLSFLVTSSTRQSAEVFAKNLPPKTVHQFLPIDAPPYVRRFLTHWTPNLAVWSEQDLWPGLAYYTDQQSIPQALINARMNQAAYSGRKLVRPVYADLLRRFFLISAQDDQTAELIKSLGALGDVRVDGSIKPLAKAVTTDIEDHAQLNAATQDRFVWLVAPSHPEDEAIAFETHQRLVKRDPAALLVVVPRYVDRGQAIVQTATKMGFHVTQRTREQVINAHTQIYVADTLGEVGYWYGRARLCLLGGSFSAIEGHNPWEAVQLGCAVTHGPRVANFARDYSMLDALGGAIRVSDADALLAVIAQDRAADITRSQGQAVDQMTKAFDKLAQSLYAAIE